MVGDLVCWNATSTASEPGLTVLDLATGRRSVLSREGVGCDVDARRLVFSGNFGGVDAYVRDLLEGEP